MKDIPVSASTSTVMSATLAVLAVNKAALLGRYPQMSFDLAGCRLLHHLLLSPHHMPSTKNVDSACRNTFYVTTITKI